MNLHTAIEIAGAGRAALRCVTQPAECVRLDAVWVVRDTGTKPWRETSILTVDLEPARVIEIFRSLEGENVHHFCESDVNETLIVKKYAALGFTLSSRYFLMTRASRPSIDVSSSLNFWRAETLETATRISSAAGEVLLSARDLPPRRLGVRLYGAEAEGRVIAWARIAQVREDTAWVDDLFTLPAFRKRGVMRQLLNFAYQDSSHFGVRETVLVCSSENLGFHLKNGYEVVAHKLQFAAKLGLLERVRNRVRRWF